MRLKCKSGLSYLVQALGERESCGSLDQSASFARALCMMQHLRTRTNDEDGQIAAALARTRSHVCREMPRLRRSCSLLCERDLYLELSICGQEKPPANQDFSMVAAMLGPRRAMGGRGPLVILAARLHATRCCSPTPTILNMACANSRRV